jgi:hypothetical protein
VLGGVDEALRGRDLNQPAARVRAEPGAILIISRCAGKRRRAWMFDSIGLPVVLLKSEAAGKRSIENPRAVGALQFFSGAARLSVSPIVRCTEDPDHPVARQRRPV